MSSADIRAGRAFVELYVKSSEFTHGLLNAETRLKTFSQSIGTAAEALAHISPGNLIRGLTDAVASLGRAVAGTLDHVGEMVQTFGKLRVIAGVGIGSALGFAAAHFGHTGDALQVMMQRTGASTKALSELGFAARQTGATIDDVETGIRMMQKTIAGAMAKPLGEDAKALATLGLRFEHLIGLSPDRQLELIADGLHSIEDPTLRAAAAIDVLGRGGTSLLPILNNGAAGVREFRTEAERLGLSVTPEQARLAEQLVDKFAALKESSFAAMFSAGEALAPMLLEAIKLATELAIQFKKWVSDNHETIRLVSKLAVGLIATGVSAMAIGAGFKAMGMAVGVLTGAFAMLGHAVAAILPFVTLLNIAISLIGTGPLISIVTAIGSAISASGILGAAVSLLGTAFSVVLPEVLLVVGAIAAGFVAVTAIVVGTGAAIVAAAVAFWKLTDPLKSMLPLVKAVFGAIGNVSKSLFSGDIQGAANAGIEGLKRIILAGTKSILTMLQNAMDRFPGLIHAVFSESGGIAIAIAETIQKAFVEIWPAIKVAFASFLLFARDAFQQLPEFAGYAAGQIVRAMFLGYQKLQELTLRVFVGIFKTILTTFSDLGPKIVAAIVSGNVTSLAAEMTHMLEGVASGVFAGIADTEMPDFKPSDDSIAMWKKLGDTAAAAHAKMMGPAAAGGSKAKGFSWAGWNTPAAGGTAEDPFAEMPAAKKSGGGVSDADAFSDLPSWIDDWKRLTDAIDPTPLEAYNARLKELKGLFDDGLISADAFNRGLKDAKATLIDPTPMEKYMDRIKELKDMLAAGIIDKKAFGIAAMDALPGEVKDIIERSKTPLEKFNEQITKARDFFDAGLINREQFEKEQERLQGELRGDKGKPELLKRRAGDVSVSFSSDALIAQGRGGGGKSSGDVPAKLDRQLTEAQKQSKLMQEIRDDFRKGRLKFG